MEMVRFYTFLVFLLWKIRLFRSRLLLQQVVYLKYTFTLLHAIYLNYVLIIHHLYVHVPCHPLENENYQF